MKIRHSFLLLILCTQAFVGLGTASGAFSLVPGHYYASDGDSNVITQYNPTRNVVGSLALSSGDRVLGLTFGADNLLYATVLNTNAFPRRSSVVALNSAGIAQQTYSQNVDVSGNISYGKIAISGQYLYVAGQDRLTRFLLGNPSSGTSIYTNNQVFDVKPLPNGRLLVASAYEIQEITTTGSVTRTIPLVASGGQSFYAIRGIEYNAATNDLFVTQLGDSNFPHKILRLDAATGVLEKEATLYYADDLFLTISGELLVGSRFSTPAFYDADLNPRGSLNGAQQLFVTQFVPEPSIVALGLSGTLLLVARRRRD